MTGSQIGLKPITLFEFKQTLDGISRILDKVRINMAQAPGKQRPEPVSDKGGGPLPRK